MANFLYRFLFTDPITGKFTQSEFFSSIGMLILIVLFPYCTLTGKTVQTELWWFFGAAVICNKSFGTVLAGRFGMKDPDSDKEKTTNG